MKSLKEQKLNKCRHFNGTQNDTCKAGVKYEDVRDKDKRGLPCFRDDLGGGKHCDKCEFKTEAEVDAEVEESNKRFQSTMTARKAIVDHLGGPWKKGVGGASGAIDCPVCKIPKALKFSRAGYNGHIHAQCATKGCVCWME